MALKRIKKELKELRENPLPFATANLDEDNFFKWNVTLLGRQNTPYEGGIFKLVIYFSEEYPFKPPKLQFVTQILHPSIYSSGSLCCCCHNLDNITWGPFLKIETVLLVLDCILANPDKNCESLSRMYINDPEKYNELAKKWTRIAMMVEGTKFCVGDKVQVLGEVELLELINEGQNNRPMSEVINRIGKITEIQSNSRTVVEFNGVKWNLNPMCLFHVTNTFNESNISTAENEITPDIIEGSASLSPSLQTNRNITEEEDVRMFQQTAVERNASLSLSLQTNRNITEEALLRYYNNKQYTDITFKVRNGSLYKYFPCHKLVISMCSPVLADELSIAYENDEIEVSDISPAAFEILIKQCYGLKEDLKKYSRNVNFLLNVLKAAKKYDIKSLENSSYAMFSSIVPSKENVFDMLEASILTNLDNLKLRCHKVLQTQTSEIIFSMDMSSVTDNILSTFLEMPTLSLTSEYELLSWFFEWANYISVKYNQQGIQKSVKDILDPYLKRLNFLSLTPKEFGLLVEKYDAFFDEKGSLAIFMNIVRPGSKELPSWCNNSVTSRTYKTETSLNE